jgi:uncharacterized protein (DUF924 family)
MMIPEDVIDHWRVAGEARWFTKDPAFDGTLAVRFKGPLEEARLGAFDEWAKTPTGALALIIMLDQFSRNIHRGSPLAFAGDGKALALAKMSIAQGFHQAMPATLSRWFVMPYEHAEDLDAQMRGVALFTTMGFADLAWWAQIHLDIIAKFGRFPHRNPILGRRSTPAELAFLAAGGFAG